MKRQNQHQLNVLLVGPVILASGITRFIICCLGAKIEARYKVFDTSHPVRQRITSRPTGYGIIFNAGVLRAMLGALISFKNIIIFPFALIISKADVVHLAGTGWASFWEFATYGIIGKILRRKVIFHYHGPFEDFYQKSSISAKKLIEWFFKQYDAIFVLSEVDKKIISGFIPNQKVYIIPNGVKINSDLQIPRRNDQQTIRVLFLGGVDPLRKGLIDLIKAANLAVEEGIQAEWIIGGTKTVLTKIDQYGLEKTRKSINFIGELSDNAKNKWYQQVDIYALPSYEEGMPYSILEAMSFGLPIISTDVGGIPEVVTDGVNGYLLKPGDVQGILECLKRLKNDPELFSTISQNNLKTIKERFSDAEILNRIDSIYQLIACK